MAAVCAGCTRPITGRQKFVLSGSEVFHRECVHLIPESKYWKMKQEILRMRTEIEEERARAARLRTEVNDLERDVANMRESRNRERENAARFQRETLRASNDLQTSNDRAGRMRSERDAAVARAEAAEREVALHRALGPVTQPTEPTPAKDDRDASEIRFSLLELDKP